MIIQPLPGYKKPTNVDSIRRPKKKLDQIQEDPAEPEPHSPELDAALAAVSELNAGLDDAPAKSDEGKKPAVNPNQSDTKSDLGISNDKREADEPDEPDESKKSTPVPRLIDDITPTLNNKKPDAVKLDASDMMDNVKSGDSQEKQPGLAPTSKSDEDSLADIEKNIVQAVEDDLGFSAHPNMRVNLSSGNSNSSNNNTKEPAKAAISSDNPKSNDDNQAKQSDDDVKSEKTSSPDKPSAPVKVTPPPKPRKMQSLFSVKDFAKPEPPAPSFDEVDNSSDDLDDGYDSDDDILSASSPISGSSIPLNRPTNRVVNRPNNMPTLDGISDTRQNQLLSSMGYGQGEKVAPARIHNARNNTAQQSQARPIATANAAESEPAAVSQSTTAAQPQNVAQAVQNLPTTTPGGFVVTRPKARVDFLAVIGIPFGAIALLTAIMPGTIVFSLGLIYISLLLTIPVMALIGLVFGIVALIKDIKQPQALNKIIAIVSIVLAVASVGMMLYRSSSFGSSLGSSLTGGSSSTTINSDSSSND